MEFSVKFKDKEYPLKDLFLQDEAKVLKAIKKMQESGEDPEVIAECGVKVISISTGIDVGDLNALTYNKLVNLFWKVTKMTKAKKDALKLEEGPDPDEGEDEKKEPAPAA